MNYKKPRNISASLVEAGGTTSASIIGASSITVNQIEIGDKQTAKITVDRLVECESKIPPDAKQAVRDFIKEQIQQLAEDVDKIVINVPEELTEYIDVILEIIQKVAG